MNFLYRYRSIDKLFKYKELDTLSIYFSKLDELNDQMEDYINIVWQGDEIAFQGLIKHYLYVLLILYSEASVHGMEEKINVKQLPIFLPTNIFNLPIMTTVFKSIYYEFFSPQFIADIPKKLAQSNKKFTIDEMALILKSIHLYAYLVISTEMQKAVYGKKLLEDKEYNKIYNEVKNWKEYSEITNLLVSCSYSEEEVLNKINQFNYQYEFVKTDSNNMNKDIATYNTDILVFEFPDLYIKDIKRLLYNNLCVACFSATFRNEPMWAHYANNENGICLKYKIKKHDNSNYIDLNYPSGLQIYTKRKKIIRTLKKCELNKVIYSKNYPEIDFFTSLGYSQKDSLGDFWFSNYDKTKFSSCLQNYNNKEWYSNYHKNAKKYICTKSKKWKYEQEYRIFEREAIFNGYEKSQSRIAQYKFDDLDSIIFGRKVSIEDKKKIIKIINKHCTKNKVNNFKFYDLYYSTISKRLELKNVIAF